MLYTLDPNPTHKSSHVYCPTSAYETNPRTLTIFSSITPDHITR